MQRLSNHDLPRSFGPQSTAIPVGGGLGMLGAIALLAGVAITVPEVGFWATVAMPASAVIGILYVVVRRCMAKPPIDLHLS
jgi:hypothetical protein